MYGFFFKIFYIVFYLLNLVDFNRSVMFLWLFLIEFNEEEMFFIFLKINIVKIVKSEIFYVINIGNNFLLYVGYMKMKIMVFVMVFR